MRKVHTAESIIEIAHLRNVLEQAGIACYVRNERLGGAVGEIPFVECWPELWVLRNGDALQCAGLDRYRACRRRTVAGLDLPPLRRARGRTVRRVLAVLDTGRDCRSDCRNRSLMPDATSLTIASRFKGPPDSGNGGYVCGAFAVAAGRPNCASACWRRRRSTRR